MAAAGRGDLAEVRRLLAEGADVNAADAMGFTALFHACYNGDEDRGYPEVVRALLEAGADREARIGYGVRPLMYAAAGRRAWSRRCSARAPTPRRGTRAGALPS